MKSTTPKKTIKKFVHDWIARLALKKIAKNLIRGVRASADAGDEILYSLPGVFTMTLELKGVTVRLIKEANTLRMMEKAERSVCSLILSFTDLTVTTEVAHRQCTVQKALSEGRLHFAGKTACLTAIIRASAYGDAVTLPDEEYFELYGVKKED